MFRNPIFLIIILPTILIALWFREGNIMATGESGAPFYDPLLQFNINKDAWARYTLGHPTNIGIAAKPTYWFMALLQSMVIPGFLIQAFFLWVNFVVAGLSIYYLTKEFFPNMPKNVVFLAPLFYWFNPFSMVNIWNRFLNNFIVFCALLPLALLLFIKGIQTKKYIYAFLLGLVSAIFSYALTSIAFNMLLWFLLSYTAIFYLFFKERSRLFVIKFLVLSLLFFSLINFWWISQVVSYVGLGSFSAVESSSFKLDSNYNTFFQLSQRLGNLTDLFRFKHASFFLDQENINWVGIYNFPLITILEFLIAGIFLFPIVVKRRQKEVLFLGGLLIFSIFFAKGNNLPLSEIFDNLFRNFSFLQVFRNPFEKIGFLLPLASAPLFCLGAALLLEKLRAGWRKTFYVSLLFWLLVVWVGPFWSNLVFTSTEVPTNQTEVGYQVTVPKFYQQAQDWLFTQGDNFRLTILPIGGEGITYTWPKGYSGVELSNQLLPVTSISFNTNIPFYNEVSQNLERIFLTRNDFSDIMNSLNAKFIVVRSDIDWKIRGMRNPQVIKNRLIDLESQGRFKMVRQFGDLLFWENLDWKDKTIYPVSGLTKVSGGATIEDILMVENHSNLAIYNSNSLKENILVRSEVVKPDVQFGLGSNRLTEVNISDDFMFPSVKILPSQYLYPAILLKEKIEQKFIRDGNTLVLKKLSLLGKRLNEAVIEAERGQDQGVLKALSLYIEQLTEVLPDLSETSKIGGDFLILQEDAYKIFLKHSERLKRVRNALSDNKKEEILEVEETLRKKLIDFKIIPNFGYIDKSNFPIRGRVVYQFAIEEQGNYELIIDSKSWDRYFKVSLDRDFMFQVDKEIVLRKGSMIDGEIVSYGFFNFTPGKHEIAWNTPEEINLVNTPQQLEFKVEHGVDEKSFFVNNFDPYSSYVLKLDYLIKRGSGVEIIVEMDNDKVKKGKLEPRFGKFLGPDTYDFETRNLTAYLVPSSTADSAKLILRVKPWNNCEEIFRRKGKDRCLDENFRRPYDRNTEVVLSNISVTKTLTELPLLRREIKESLYSTPQISYEKNNASEYRVKVNGADKPFILVLSQLFDPAWKIIFDVPLSEGKELEARHFLANTYANGWIIDRKGDYELTIKFMPQDVLRLGEKISLGTFLAGVFLVGWKLRRSKNEI